MIYLVNGQGSLSFVARRALFTVIQMQQKILFLMRRKNET